ncbi:unnamed protein product, partial [Rotaria sp. Silwood2]
LTSISLQLSSFGINQPNDKFHQCGFITYTHSPTGNDYSIVAWCIHMIK